MTVKINFSYNCINILFVRCATRFTFETDRNLLNVRNK